MGNPYVLIDIAKDPSPIDSAKPGHGIDYIVEKKVQLEEKIGFSYTPLKTEIKAISFFVASITLFPLSIALWTIARTPYERSKAKGFTTLALFGITYSLFKLFASPITIYATYRCWKHYQD